MHFHPKFQIYFIFCLGGLPALARATREPLRSRRDPNKTYIIGGQNLGPSDPIQNSTVALFDPSSDGRGGSLCTASLIGNDVALTAAHCVPPGGGAPVVLFGRNLKAPGTQKRVVDAVAVNPKWKSHAGIGSDQGDIALVKFEGGLPAGYGAVPTSNADSDISKGEKITLAGYGISNATTKQGAGVLRKTVVEVANNRPGKTEMVLSQRKGHGACHGDSGGPAFIRKNGQAVLAGVTNRGYPDTAPDDCAHDVVYTKLPAYQSWIQKSEKKLESTPSARPSIALARGPSAPLTKNTRTFSKRGALNSTAKKIHASRPSPKARVSRSKMPSLARETHLAHSRSLSRRH